ncbi:MAG: hypothetical protein HC933_18755 [Pleurocapsa sp. SU_196_0]|nr:hypothetical protein [Pleurocapsa sp. SU_196_0]
MTSLRNPPLELTVLVLLSAVIGVVAVVFTLFVADLVQGRGLNFAALTRSESLSLYPAFAVGLAVTAVIWYIRRGDALPFRFWDGVIWGVVCFALVATIALLTNLPSILKDPVIGLGGTVIFIYVVGGLFALPAIFTVAPFTVWVWHTTLAALRR